MFPTQRIYLGRVSIEVPSNSLVQASAEILHMQKIFLDHGIYDHRKNLTEKEFSLLWPVVHEQALIRHYGSKNPLTGIGNVQLIEKKQFSPNVFTAFYKEDTIIKKPKIYGIGFFLCRNKSFILESSCHAGSDTEIAKEIFSIHKKFMHTYSKAELTDHISSSSPMPSNIYYFDKIAFNNTREKDPEYDLDLKACLTSSILPESCRIHVYYRQDNITYSMRDSLLEPLLQNNSYEYQADLDIVSNDVITCDGLQMEELIVHIETEEEKVSWYMLRSLPNKSTQRYLQICIEEARPQHKHVLMPIWKHIIQSFKWHLS